LQIAIVLSKVVVSVLKNWGLNVLLTTLCQFISKKKVNQSTFLINVIKT